MNLKAILILTYCIITSSLHAQKINLEFLGGPNLSTMYGVSVYKSDAHSKVGFATGIGFSYKLKEHLSLSLKGLFERKGCAGKFKLYYYDGGVSGQNNSADYKFRYISNYLTLPITLQYTRGNRIKYTGEAGFFTGVLTKATFKTKQITGSGYETTDETSSNKRMDAGLSLGFRTSFPLGEKINLNVILFDNVGLLNTSKTGTSRTNAFNILTGLSFSL